MEKLLLLDFDGVLNALTPLPSSRDTSLWVDLEEIYVPVPVDDTGRTLNQVVRFSPTVVAEVNSLIPHIETRWFSSWFSDTESLPTAMGVAALPYEGDFSLDEGISEEWWKLTWLKNNHLDREIIWVDDTVNEAGVQDWLVSQNGRVRTLYTNSRTGLNAGNLQKLRKMVTK